MVTRPNWMAPFHIARATAGPPCSRASPAGSRRPAGRRAVTYSARAQRRARHGPGVGDLAEDDECVERDHRPPDVPSTRSSIVCVPERPERRSSTSAAAAGCSTSAGRPCCEHAVDVDRGLAARRARSARRRDPAAVNGRRGRWRRVDVGAASIGRRGGRRDRPAPGAVDHDDDRSLDGAPVNGGPARPTGSSCRSLSLARTRNW